MTAIWPSELPDKQFLGLTFAPAGQVIRTAMSTGPAKTRRRATARPIPVSIPIRYTGAEYKRLWAFHDTTLSSGSLEFTWRSPLDDSTVTMRFVDPPGGTCVVSGDTDDRQWTGDLSLEILP